MEILLSGEKGLALADLRWSEGVPRVDTLLVPHLQQALGFRRAPGSCGRPGLGDKEAHVRDQCHGGGAGHPVSGLSVSGQWQ